MLVCKYILFFMVDIIQYQCQESVFYLATGSWVAISIIRQILKFNEHSGKKKFLQKIESSNSGLPW